MAARIHLRQEAVAPFSTPDRTVSRIRGSVLEAENITTKIFVHQLDADGNPDFVRVAGPYEIANIPADAPVVGVEYPYYRLAAYDKLVPGVNEADEATASIRQQVKTLCETADALDVLEQVFDGWLPS